MMALPLMYLWSFFSSAQGEQRGTVGQSITRVCFWREVLLQFYIISAVDGLPLPVRVHGCPVLLDPRASVHANRSRR